MASSSWLLSSISSVLLFSSSASIAFFLHSGEQEEWHIPQRRTFSFPFPLILIYGLFMFEYDCMHSACAHFSMASSRSRSACCRIAPSSAPVASLDLASWIRHQGFVVLLFSNLKHFHRHSVTFCCLMRPMLTDAHRDILPAPNSESWRIPIAAAVTSKLAGPHSLALGGGISRYNEEDDSQDSHASHMSI